MAQPLMASGALLLAIALGSERAGLALPAAVLLGAGIALFLGTLGKCCSRRWEYPRRRLAAVGGTAGARGDGRARRRPRARPGRLGSRSCRCR
ncbi:MAG: hypothetical protein U1F11_11110 [Steroidobacteraceae bacterium]